MCDQTEGAKHFWMHIYAIYFLFSWSGFKSANQSEIPTFCQHLHAKTTMLCSAQSESLAFYSTIQKQIKLYFFSNRFEIQFCPTTHTLVPTFTWKKQPHISQHTPKRCATFEACLRTLCFFLNNSWLWAEHTFLIPILLPLHPCTLTPPTPPVRAEVFPWAVNKAFKAMGLN